MISPKVSLAGLEDNRFLMALNVLDLMSLEEAHVVAESAPRVL